jgi:hypothetical protein
LIFESTGHAGVLFLSIMDDQANATKRGSNRWSRMPWWVWLLILLFPMVLRPWWLAVIGKDQQSQPSLGVERTCRRFFGPDPARTAPNGNIVSANSLKRQTSAALACPNPIDIYPLQPCLQLSSPDRVLLV